MPSQHNQDQVAAINAKLDRAQALIIADYAGLNVAAQTDLRAKAKAADSEMSVAKNRLVALALKKRLSELPETLQKAFEGPNAVIYAYSDAAAAAKVLVDFARDNENLTLKIGLLLGQDGQPNQVITLTEVKNLASLPSRDQLLAQLVGQLNAPITGLVQVLSGPQRQLVYVLNAIKDKQTQN